MPSLYCLSRFCTTCLQNNTNLVEVKRSNDINSICAKLSLCVTDVDWSFVKQFYMCTACIQVVELSFTFRQNCKKSAAALRNYVDILQNSEENLKKVQGDINIPLSKDDVPQKYVDELNTQQVACTPNIILPNNLYSFLTNGQFPIFKIIPSSSVGPVAGQSYINQVPPLMLINSVPSKPPQPDAMTKEVNDLLNSAISEEVSVSVDPMAFNLDDDDDNLLDIAKEEPQSLDNYRNGERPKCYNCNLEFDTRRDLKIHRMKNAACAAVRKYSFQKGTKSAQCHICKRKFCTPQYLQHHLELHEKKGVVQIGRRSTKGKTAIPKPPQKTIRKNHSKENIGKKCKVNKQTENLTVKEIDKNVRISDNIAINDEMVNVDSDDSLEAICIEPEITISHDFDSFEENPLNLNDQNPLSDNDTSAVNEQNLLTIDRLSPSVDKSITTSTKEEDEPILIEDDDKLDLQNQVGLLNGLRVQIVDGKSCCGYCGKLFECLDNLQHHISAIHHDKMHFRCQFCKQRFLDSHKLKQHLPQHYNYFLCKCCNESFTSVIEVQCHMIESHKVGFETTRCVTCAEDFDSLASLKEHGELHLKNLVFVCHVCDEKAKDADTFSAHILQHYKLYKCVSCQLQFYNESEFVTHLESHTGG